MRKAFKDFNEDNDPFIDKDELVHFLTHWGLPLRPDQEDVVFSFFDKDRDGRISYQDFVQSIGYEIHPSETLYFRQEKSDAMVHRDQPCDQEGCWASVTGSALFCISHLKQNQQKILKLYANLYNRISNSDKT